MTAALEELQKYAARRGGKCLLEKAPTPPHAHIRWQCAKNHIWNGTLAAFSKGKWCPECAKSGRSFVEDMRILASQYGGQCLSEMHKRTSAPLLWRCKEGHEFLANAGTIRKRGIFCRTCHWAKKSALSLERMHALAKQRGGKLLSTEYIPANRGRMRWRCAHGHVWDMVGITKIVLGRWCPTCSGRREGRFPLDIEVLKAAAIARGGQCLSPQYLGYAAMLEWRCREGHTWMMKPQSIRAGRWCRVCRIRK